MIEFAGYDMPLHYGSQINEHHVVRQDAGMFDVSHMGMIDIVGTGANIFLRKLLANNIDKLKASGHALYTCMLNDEGGIIDDLIVYFIAKDQYRLVVNAATKEKDLQWIHKQLKSDSNFSQIKVNLNTHSALIAVQGPHARSKAANVLSEYEAAILALKPFELIVDMKQQENDWLIARTGYTGEDGVEIMLPATEAPKVWLDLLKAGVKPAGLGARDTLRLEAGLNLYGQDMDESVSPMESNLTWTVAFDPKDRLFIGRDSLERQNREGVKKKLLGLELQEKGVLRHDQTVWVDDKSIGRVTSGSFSPTLSRAIGLARIELANTDMKQYLELECTVEIRGKKLKAKIVQTPFVRRAA